MDIGKKIATAITNIVKSTANSHHNNKEADDKIILLEQQYCTSQRALSVALADTRRLEMCLDEFSLQIEQWHGKALSFLKSNDETGTRKALEREFAIKTKLEQHKAAHTEQKKRTDALLLELDASKQQLEAIKRDYNAVSAHKESALVKRQLARATVKDRADSIAFDINHLAHEALRCEAEADAILSMHPELKTDKQLEKEFVAIEMENEVQKALDLLKNELRGTPGKTQNPGSAQ